MSAHLAESLATHISLLTTQTQTLAGRGGQDNLLPHLSLLALHNQQLTQLILQLKESLEELKTESQHKIQELEKENKVLKQKVNKDLAKLKESLEKSQLKLQELEREKQAQAIVTTKSKHDIKALTLKVNEDLEREVAELRRQQDKDKALFISLHQYVHVFPIGNHQLCGKEEQ